MKTLQELFNKPLEARIYSNNMKGLEADFRVGNDLYNVMISRLDDEFGMEKTYEVEFSMEGSDKRFGITNKGDAIKIFATVIDLVKNWEKKHKPNIIFFTAEEPSRIKLYKTLIKKLSAGYEKEIIVGSSSYRGTLFKLTKK